MKKLILNGKLKGSSLIYSLMISLLVSALLSAYLMADFSYRGLVRKTYAELNVQELLRSGLSLALAKEGLNKVDALAWQHKADSIWITYEDWGGFKLVQARASHFQEQGKLTALIGQKLPSDKQGLILSDEGFPLVLQADTKVQGNMLVPGGEILSERYEGKAFTGDKPSPKQIHRSKKLYQTDFPDIPWPVKTILDSLQNQISSAQHLVLRDSITQNWDADLRMIKVRGNLHLAEGSYQKKIMFMATESIEIEVGASLEDVILIAPSIKMQSGVRGRFQAFASDSLLLSDDVQLQFPSLLALSAKPDRPAILEIKTGCRIEGAVLFYQPIDFTPPSTLRPQVRIGTRSTVYGTVHVAGNLELHGVVGGMVIAKGFVLRTAVGTVRNHLLNAQLWEDRLAPAYAGPFLFANTQHKLLKIYHHERKKLATTWK
ncbi:MAG: hypothetical protein AAF927_08405 [Bacteroidota bacterium]